MRSTPTSPKKLKGGHGALEDVFIFTRVSKLPFLREYSKFINSISGISFYANRIHSGGENIKSSNLYSVLAGEILYSIKLLTHKGGNINEF